MKWWRSRLIFVLIAVNRSARIICLAETRIFLTLRARFSSSLLIPYIPYVTFKVIDFYAAGVSALSACM